MLSRFKEFLEQKEREEAKQICLAVLKSASGLQGGRSLIPELKEYLTIRETKSGLSTHTFLAQAYQDVMGPDDENFISLFHQCLGEDGPIVETQRIIFEESNLCAFSVVVNLSRFFTPTVLEAERSLQIARSFVGTMYSINQVKNYNPNLLATRAETKAFQASL